MPRVGPGSCILEFLSLIHLFLSIFRIGTFFVVRISIFFFFHHQDSFQQHDVQELCRVLFDALESTFQGTVNEKLVNNLYQGERRTTDGAFLLVTCTGSREGGGGSTRRRVYLSRRGAK